MHPNEVGRELAAAGVRGGIAMNSMLFKMGPFIRHALVPSAASQTAPFLTTRIYGSWETAEFAAAINGYGFAQRSVSINHPMADGEDTCGLMLLLPSTADREDLIDAFAELGLDVLHPAPVGWYFPDWTGTDPIDHAARVLGTTQGLELAIGHVSVIPGRIKVLHESEYSAVFARHDPSRGGAPPDPAVENRRRTEQLVNEFRARRSSGGQGD